MAESATATAAPPIGGSKRDHSNPWGRSAVPQAPSTQYPPQDAPPDAVPTNIAASVGSTTASACGRDGAEKKNLADIMAEEEAQKRAQDSESEEDRMVRLAMEASLLDAAPAAAAAAAASASTDTAASSAGSGHDHLDEEMRLAIALSLKESGSAADVVAMDGSSETEVAAPPAAAASAAEATPHGQLSEEEAEAIARAMQQADDADAAASLRLALELQREEERGLASQRQAASASRRIESGNVRTVFKDDFLYQRGDAPDSGNGEGNQERKLWSADDFESHQSHYGSAAGGGGPASGAVVGNEAGDDNDDDDREEVHEGFRMNASTPSKSWSRLDRNTIVGPGNQVRTKHDVALKNRSNAERLLGRGGGDDARIGDQAYNKFKQDQRKRSTVKGVAAHGHGRAEGYEGGRTRGGAMDAGVRLLVAKAVNTGLVDCCNGVVKEGKEAIVYHADAGRGTVDDEGNTVGGSDGHDVAVKVFKRIQEFRGRGAYVDGDSRYHRTKFKNVGSRTQVELWAEKEYRNLVRANRAGVPVPSPLLQKENVLFMRFLGEDGWPSPQLREIEIKKGSRKWETLYAQVIMAVRRLYHCARLIHGDLSEYNILICPSSLVENGGNGQDKDNSLQIVLIDFAQGVEWLHPSASELLRRDLTMVRVFFARQGIQVLTDDDAESFVLTPCGRDMEEDSSDDDSALDSLPKEGLGETDGTKKTCQQSIPSWDDDADFERLQGMLKTAKLASTTPS